MVFRAAAISASQLVRPMAQKLTKACFSTQQMSLPSNQYWKAINIPGIIDYQMPLPAPVKVVQVKETKPYLLCTDEYAEPLFLDQSQLNEIIALRLSTTSRLTYDEMAFNMFQSVLTQEKNTALLTPCDPLMTEQLVGFKNDLNMNMLHLLGLAGYSSETLFEIALLHNMPPCLLTDKDMLAATPIHYANACTAPTNPPVRHLLLCDQQHQIYRPNTAAELEKVFQQIWAENCHYVPRLVPDSQLSLLCFFAHIPVEPNGIEELVIDEDHLNINTPLILAPEPRLGPMHRGVFAAERIEKFQLIGVLGGSMAIPSATIHPERLTVEINANEYDHNLYTFGGLFQISPKSNGKLTTDFFSAFTNGSTPYPNTMVQPAIISGIPQLMAVTMRSIEAVEQILFSYTTDRWCEEHNGCEPYIELGKPD